MDVQSPLISSRSRDWIFTWLTHITPIQTQSGERKRTVETQALDRLLMREVAVSWNSTLSLHLSLRFFDYTNKTRHMEVVLIAYNGREVRWNTIQRETLASNQCRHPTDRSVFSHTSPFTMGMPRFELNGVSSHLASSFHLWKVGLVLEGISTQVP